MTTPEPLDPTRMAIEWIATHLHYDCKDKDTHSEACRKVDEIFEGYDALKAGRVPAPSLPAPETGMVESCLCEIVGQVESWRARLGDPVGETMKEIEAFARKAIAAIPIDSNLALPAPLEWTKEKPKAPGWYWCRVPGMPEAEEIYQFAEDENGNLFEPAEYEDDITNLSEFNPNCEWAGPIPPPKEQSPEVQK